MSNSPQDEQQALEQYLEEKAKQEQQQQQQQQQQQESEPLSEYEACVLRESARVRELMVEALKKVEGE
ncbi:hypothetical protein [uncultured Psychrobacter sp.]|uniref:hypothetical protein n=1 Tax=uncultured Psychrobacter sp. TaxID=259303 RepID=UPI00261E0B5A|nr:hypothetical protein [uncultured Psychrobacter sp.]